MMGACVPVKNIRVELNNVNMDFGSSPYVKTVTWTLCWVTPDQDSIYPKIFTCPIYKIWLFPNRLYKI